VNVTPKSARTLPEPSLNVCAGCTNAPMSNWMSEGELAASATRCGIATPSNSAICDIRKLAVPAFMAVRRLMDRRRKSSSLIL